MPQEFIPTPVPERLRQGCRRVLPVIVFAVALVTVGVLWENENVVRAPVAQAKEPVPAIASSQQTNGVAGLVVVDSIYQETSLR